MKLIKLHTIRDGENGVCLLNVDTIELVKQVEQVENGCVIFFSGGKGSLRVRENLDTIMRLVNETNI